MEERYDRLARYLYAAYTAHRGGISLQTAFNRYAKDLTVGPFWYAAAAALEKAAVKEMDLMFKDALRASAHAVKPCDVEHPKSIVTGPRHPPPSLRSLYTLVRQTSNATLGRLAYNGAT
jgi:hypothetical protein